jgi:hypothetical protein
VNNFAHTIDRFEPLLLAVFVPVALLGWFYGFVAKAGTRRRLMAWEPIDQDARFVLGLGVFGAILGGTFMVGSYVNAAALDEISSRLSAKIERVTVNGQLFENGDVLVNALKHMSNTGAHHSSPEQTFEIILASQSGSINFVLRRDSQNPHEYWVFYDGFRSTQTRDVARVFTDVLDTK